MVCVFWLYGCGVRVGYMLVAVTMAESVGL
jgi:hypothetical protein